MKKSKTLRYLKEVLYFLPKERRTQLFYLIPISIIAGISELIVIFLLARLFNFIIGKPNPSINLLSNVFDFEPKYKILILISAFILSNWFSSIIKIILKAKQFRLKATIWRDLSDQALKNLLSQEYDFFLANNKTDLSASVLLNINKVSDIVVLPVLQVVSGGFIIAFISITVLVIAKSTAFFLILGLLIGYLSISLYIIPKIRISNRKRIDLEITSNGILNEAIRSIIDVKLSNSQKYFFKRYKKKGRDLIPTIEKSETLPEIPRALVEPFGISLIFIIGIFPYFTINDINQISEIIPFLATIAAASLKLTPPLQDTFRAYNSIRGGIPDLEETVKLIKLSNNNQFNQIKKPSFDKNFIYPKKKISFKNVYYKYPETELDVIKNLSFDINVGSKVAFVGATGSGKTTTVNLLLQLLKPNMGHLYLDNNILKSKDVTNWQAHCSYVPQSFYLNNTTILENIAFAQDRDDIDLPKVKKAIDSAKLTELISKLPRGLETIIGENGIALSGGQRQRLAIARAFYRESKLLIMDEATSSLDNKTESKVMESIDLKGNNCTLIIIAHRLSTVINADIIFEFNGGEISHSGSFEELCRNSESFKDLSVLEKKILK
ncbi:ABC transporter ATP-binding protein [Prochlorococcus marinus]|uniref:ABC transporter ATP-binding protein n=1 Tax=Prochlorococcus marinus TaxID=1219 RepID=UPI000A61CF15|nr:ABC transporter ATP-binding protein [Prochlorococcus marinus]